MRVRTNMVALALAAGLAAPSPAWAWGAPGCTNLPEYERALGALQGMTSACDMSVERASRIVAAHGNTPGGLFGRLMGGSPRPVAEPAPVADLPPRRMDRPHRPRASRDEARRPNTAGR